MRKGGVKHPIHQGNNGICGGGFSVSPGMGALPAPSLDGVGPLRALGGMVGSQAHHIAGLEIGEL